MKTKGFGDYGTKQYSITLPDSCYEETDKMLNGLKMEAYIEL